MNKSNKYSPREEKFNIISHAAAFIFSISALVLLVIKAGLHGNNLHLICVSIFGASLMLLYLASTCYHCSKKPVLRKRLRILDHASIYILIAGTYTPFTLIVLGGSIGWVIFACSWGMAFIGIILKLFFTGKYDKLSTIMYVLMSWIIVFAIGPLIDNLSFEGLFWLFTGGFFYTSGAILYVIDKLKFNHAIFHIFVMLGSISHFISVYFYVLPGKH